jgi:O-antigen/teichoic acid export membrane protein
MRSAIVVDLSTAVIQLGLLLAVGAIAGLSAAMVFIVIGAGCFMVTFSWLVIYRSEFKFAWSRIKADWGRNWLLGRWGLASAVLWISASSLYPWILAAYHGTRAAGVWAACIGVVALCNPLLVGLQNYILPKASHVFAENGANALRSFVPRAALLIGGLVTALCVVLAPIGGWLVTVIYGDPYSGNSLVVTLLLVNFSIRSFDFCFSRGLYILERADIDFKINIVPLILVFLIGIWLVKGTGVPGAALSILIGNTAGLVLRVVSFYRVSD